MTTLEAIRLYNNRLRELGYTTEERRYRITDLSAQYPLDSTFILALDKATKDAQSKTVRMA